jgi:hypothetical protein
MSVDLEWIWKEVVVVYSRHHPGFCLKRMREILRIVSMPTGIRTVHLQNTSLEHYRCINLYDIRRFITQPVTGRLPPVAVRVRPQVTSNGICGGESGSEAGFLLVLLLPVLIAPNVSYSSTMRGWYNGPISGRRTKWTQSHPTSRNKK